MEKQTSFDIEDAEVLLKQLQEFNQTLKQEWSKVVNQWANLKTNWRDSQFDKFEPFFEKLSATYNVANFESEVYIGFLEKQIEIAKKQRFNLLKAVEKPIKIAQAVMVLGGMNVNSTTQTAGLPQQSSSSYVQQKESNSCLINEKTDSEKSPAIQQYNSLPGIARVMSAEDQLNEAYPQEKEKESKRTEKEAKDSADAINTLKASGSPPPTDSTKLNLTQHTNSSNKTVELTNAASKHLVTEFANSLDYQIRYGSFAVGDSGRIEAVDSEGNYTDCFINFEATKVGQVRIKDIWVAPNYRIQGIGFKLLSALESHLPTGTLIYLSENQRESFWKNNGFESRENHKITEYYKIIP